VSGNFRINGTLLLQQGAWHTQKLLFDLILIAIDAA
jgi:hypothetical protein